MNPQKLTYARGPIFDGTTLHDGKAARFEDGVFTKLLPETQVSTEDVIELEGDILSLGYVDLQVNGGGGVMFNDDPSVDTLRTMATAHRRLGVTKMLPTLITDSVGKTHAAIEAVQSAISGGLAGIAGLHLEGPHLSVARKGAHDAKFIRPMDGADLQTLLSAKETLPVLKITLAPETVSLDQVAKLTQAGIVVSLGHTDAEFDTCMDYVKAGARCATHLFNAMSQLGNRSPGLVGAALSSGALSAGLIADGVHVHPEAMRVAWTSKVKPGRIFLVSDAMAVAGTDLDAFDLDGRPIRRSGGQLRLADGTLAGADLDLTTAVSVLVGQVGVDLCEALVAATTTPATLCAMDNHHLQPGVTLLQDMNLISSDLSGLRPLPAISGSTQ